MSRCDGSCADWVPGPKSGAINRSLGGQLSAADQAILCRAMPLSRASILDRPTPDTSGDEPEVLAPHTVHECDMCGGTFEGVPVGCGLLLWTRGEEVRREEPPLCSQCSSQLLLGALMRWAQEDDEEGE